MHRRIFIASLALAALRGPASAREWVLSGGRYHSIDPGQSFDDYMTHQRERDDYQRDDDASDLSPGPKDDVAASEARSSIPVIELPYAGPEQPGTIIISTEDKRLTLVEPDHLARIYGVGVGKEGFSWSGTEFISRKAEWPGWTPPSEMMARRPDLPRHMEGGINNPLGARAMYLGRTLFRIHGTNEPDTIGRRVSSGCIRMTNADVMDLYRRVPVGTKVIVR